MMCVLLLMLSLLLFFYYVFPTPINLHSVDCKPLHLRLKMGHILPVKTGCFETAFVMINSLGC